MTSSTHVFGQNQCTKTHLNSKVNGWKIWVDCLNKLLKVASQSLKSVQLSSMKCASDVTEAKSNVKISKLESSISRSSWHQQFLRENSLISQHNCRRPFWHFYIAPKKSLLSPTGSTFGFCSVPNLKLHQYPVTATSIEPATKPDKEYISEDGKLVKVLKIEEPTVFSRCKEKTKKAKLADSLKQEKTECENGHVVVGKVEEEAKETSKALVPYDRSTCNFIDTLNSEIQKVKELVKKNVIKNKKPYENKLHKKGKSSDDATYVKSKENIKPQPLKRYDMRETRSFIKQKQKEREERENEEKKKKASEREERKKKLIELKEKQKKILQTCKRRVIDEKPQWVGPLEVVPRQKKKLPINRRFRSLQRNDNFMRQNTSVIRTRHENEARGDYRYPENYPNEFMSTSEDLSSIKTSKSESAISFVNYAFVDFQGKIGPCEDLSHIVRSESLKQKDSFYPLDHLKNAEEALKKRINMEDSATSLSVPVSKYLKAVPWKQVLTDDPSRPKTPHWLKDLSQDPDPFNLINTFKRKLQSLEEESYKTKTRFSSQTRIINSSVPSFQNFKLSTLKTSEHSNITGKSENLKKCVQEKKPQISQSSNSLKSDSTDYLIENYQKLIKGEKPCKKGKKRHKKEKKNALVRVCSEDFDLLKNDSSNNYKSISECSSKSAELQPSEYYLANSDFSSFHSDSYKNLSDSTKASGFSNQNVNVAAVHTTNSLVNLSQHSINKDGNSKFMQAYKDEEQRRQFLNDFESSLINKAKVCIAEMEARKQKLIGKGKESEIVFLKKQERELMLKLYDDLKEVFRIRKLEKAADKNKAKNDVMQMVPSALNKSIIMSSPTISDPVSEILNINTIDYKEKAMKKKNSMEKIVSTILKTPLSPRLTILKRCDSAKSEESLALSNEPISDKSNTEVRVSALQHQLEQRKVELEKLRKEYHKSKRERLLSKEQSLIHQIQAYDTYIDQVKNELQIALKNKEEKLAKPLIKQPKCLERKKSESLISTEEMSTNADSKSSLVVSEQIVSPAITEAKDHESSDETITDETIILSKDVCNQTDQAYFEVSAPASLILECESAQESKVQEYIAEEKILSDFLESANDYIPSKMEQNKIISQLLQPVSSLDKMLYTVSLEDISAEASYPIIVHEDDKMEYLQYNAMNTYDFEDSESESFDDTTQISLVDKNDGLEEIKVDNISQNIFTFVINEATDAALNAFDKKKRFLQSQGDGVLVENEQESAESVGWHGEGSLEEREALNLQQLQIEHEIQELEAQEAAYFNMMPFYAFSRVPPSSEEEVLFYISQAVEIIWKGDTKGIKPTEMNIPDHFMFNNDGSFREFMFDFTKNLYLKFKPPMENKPDWDQIPKKPLPPIRTKNEILQYIEKEAKIILGFESITIRENMIMKWSRKKRDLVDEILIKELRDDENNWINYNLEENMIKNKIAEFLIDNTLSEAVIGLTSAFTVKFSNDLRFLDA